MPIGLAICAIFAVIVFRLHELFPPSLVAFRPALLTGFIGLLVLSRGGRAINWAAIRRDRLLLGVFAYVAWAGFTIPTAFWRAAALETFWALLPLLAVTAAFGLLPSAMRTADTIARAFVFCGIVLAVSALALNQSIAGRLTATFSFDPNSLGAMMAVVIPFGLGMLVRGRTPERLLGLCSVLVCGLVLVLSQSRGSTLGLIVSLAAFAAGCHRRTRGVMIAAMVSTAVVGWMVAPPAFKERMATMVSPEEDYNTTSYGGRIQIWKRGLGYLAASPLTGVGVGNFEVAEGVHNTELGVKGKWSAPHNTYLEAFVELGIPGGALFVALYILSFRSAAQWTALSRRGKTLSSKELRPELLASLAGLFVSGIFLGLAYFWALFALWGMASLLERIVLRQRVQAVRLLSTNEAVRSRLLIREVRR